MCSDNGIPVTAESHQITVRLQSELTPGEPSHYQTQGDMQTERNSMSKNEMYINLKKKKSIFTVTYSKSYFLYFYTVATNTKLRLVFK